MHPFKMIILKIVSWEGYIKSHKKGVVHIFWTAPFYIPNKFYQYKIFVFIYFKFLNVSVGNVAYFNLLSIKY